MIRKSILIAALLSTVALIGLSQTGAPAEKAIAPDKAIQDNVILRAMRDELDRSRQLRVIGGADAAPYYIGYSMDDSNSFHISAAMGAVIDSAQRHFRAPSIEVRVGSYDFDQTGHIYSGIYTGTRLDGAWPLDDNYATLRQALWLSTDRAYKTALESIARKRAALNNASAPPDKLPDFARVEPVKNIEKITRQKIDEPAWTSRVVKLSSIFNAYPEVMSSGVEFQAIDGVTYMMDSEGTALRYPDSVAYVYTKAQGQAPDGMFVHDAAVFPATETGNLPPESEMQTAFTSVAENIKALVRAPAGEAFSGPTLFEPQAAAQLLAQLLGENLTVPRKPIADPGRTVNFVPSEFETKIGSRILPDWIDVTDDPNAASWNGKPLAGNSPYDMEGVPGKAVAVVEKGILKNFLTTRQPVKGFLTSNGHARLPGGYGARRAAITDLFVKASQTTPLADLKKKLIDMCRERGKPYGMLVRKLDFPYSGGGSELRSLVSTASQDGGSVRPVSPPVLVYRVYPDGREELVRGLRFRGVSTRTLRDVLAASQETALFQYVNNSGLLAVLGAGGYLAPTSVVAPGMLFDEIEFDLPQEQLQKPPIVPAPTE